MRTQSHGAGQLLPVGLRLGGLVRVGQGLRPPTLQRLAKKAVQPHPRQSFVHRHRILGTLQQVLAHPLFVNTVAAQVKQGGVLGASQHQGLAKVRRTGQAQASRRCCPQGDAPSLCAGGHVGPQGGQAQCQGLHLGSRRTEPIHRRHSQGVHGQTGMTAPLHLRQHGSGHQHGG